MVGSSNIQINPFSIDIETDLTIGAGLGSSASLLVAVAAGFYQYIRYRSHKEDGDTVEIDFKKVSNTDLDCISSWAFEAEKIIHGTPSGLDNTICTFGSLVEYRRDDPLKLVELPTRLQILLVNTKVPKATKALVAKVALLMRKFPDVVKSIMDAIDNISIEAVALLKLSELGTYREDVSDARKGKILEIYTCIGVSSS